VTRDRETVIPRCGRAATAGAVQSCGVSALRPVRYAPPGLGWRVLAWPPLSGCQAVARNGPRIELEVELLDCEVPGDGRPGAGQEPRRGRRKTGVSRSSAGQTTAAESGTRVNGVHALTCGDAEDMRAGPPQVGVLGRGLKRTRPESAQQPPGGRPSHDDDREAIPSREGEPGGDD